MAEIDTLLFKKLRGFELERSPLHRVLQRLATLPGAVGRSATRKSNRRDVKILAGLATKRLTALASEMGPEDVFVDLGAHRGSVARIFAEAGATVHAYEPDPWNFELMQETLKGFDNVVLHQKAVGAKAETLTLKRPAHVSRGRGSQSSSLFASAYDGKTEDFEVEVVAYDQLIADLGGHVRLVKMDIEGAELGILEAMQSGHFAVGAETLLVETHEFMFPDAAARYDRLRDWAKGRSSQVDLNWH